MITPPVPAQFADRMKIAQPEGATAGVYNKSFINLKPVFTEPDAEKIRSLYKIQIFPAFLFLESNGKLVYKTGGNVFVADGFNDMANTALARISSGKTLSHYEDLLNAGNIDRKQLEEYISLRQEFDMHDNAELADKYVGLLTVNELDDYSRVLFILKMGPYAYGKAFGLAYTNKRITDSIFKREPLEIRKAINNRTIVNTRAKAIKEKDLKGAQNLAAFIRTTWGTDYKEAQKGYTEELLNYYRAVKDTTNYYQQASYYYDQYLYISADSAKKLQDKTLEVLRMPETVKTQLNSAMATNSGTFGRVVAIPAGDQVSSSLNNGAYSFYTLGTTNINLLIKALLWSRRSIEIRPLPEYYDTMAHIMYRMKFYDEAVLNQTKAIELAKNSVGRAQMAINWQSELDKMKARKL